MNKLPAIAGGSTLVYATLAVTMGMISAWRYWSWLLAERD